MRALKNTEDSEKRMLTISEAAAYMSMGDTMTRKVCKENDCIRYIGRRVLVDLHVLDKYLDNLPHSKEECETLKN